MWDSLKTQPGSSLLSPLGVRPDFFLPAFIQIHLGNEMIMLLFLGQESVNPENLQR